MSNNLTIKKQRERRIFDDYKASSGNTFPELPQSGNDPVPDFLLQGFGKVLGIELVEYHHAEVLRGQEAIRKRFVNDAKKEFEQSNQDPLWVSFHFHPDFHKTINSQPNKQAQLAKSMADYIRKEITIPSAAHRNIELERYAKYGLDLYFMNIHVSTFPPNTNSQWEPAPGGFFDWNIFSTEALDALNATILKKNSDYLSYIQNCDECWLLIHASGMPYSALDMDTTITSEKLKLITTSPFSKIILFDRGSKKLIMLKDE